MPEQHPVSVRATLRFQRNLRQLAKKYRNIRQDLDPIIQQLQNGQQPGEQIPGLSFAVFKLRVKSRDLQKGKSGGYRLIYYVQTAMGIVLVTIYAKSEQANITTAELQTLIKQYEAEQSRGKRDRTDAP